MVHRHLRLVIAFLIICGTPNVGTGDEAAETDSADEISFALRASQANRETLTRGAFRISGTKSFYYADQEHEPAEGRVDGFYAFDTRTGLQRFDMRIPVMMGFRSRKNPETPERELRRTELNSVRQDEYFAWYDEAKSHIRTSLHLDLPQTEWSGGLDFANALFDIRAAGLSNFEQFQNGTSLREVIDALIRDMTTYHVEGDILRLEGGQPEYGIEVIVVLDVARNYLPLSLKTVAEGSGTVMSTRAEWEEQNETWVPVSLFVELVEPWEDKLSYERFEYNFEWSHVNEDMPLRFFSYEDFPDVENGVRVVDRRGQEPRLVGIWQDGNVMQAATKPLYADAPISSPGLSKWVWLNLALILLFFIAWQVRRHLKGTV